MELASQVERQRATISQMQVCERRGRARAALRRIARAAPRARVGCRPRPSSLEWATTARRCGGASTRQRRAFWPPRVALVPAHDRAPPIPRTPLSPPPPLPSPGPLPAARACGPSPCMAALPSLCCARAGGGGDNPRIAGEDSSHYGGEGGVRTTARFVSLCMPSIARCGTTALFPPFPALFEGALACSRARAGRAARLVENESACWWGRSAAGARAHLWRRARILGVRASPVLAAGGQSAARRARRGAASAATRAGAGAGRERGRARCRDGRALDGPRRVGQAARRQAGIGRMIGPGGAVV